MQCLQRQPSLPRPNPPTQPQGDEATGRPLLARALAIQEVELGPNHPDVIAIRDVLDEGL